jgi:hypothetical protein
LAFELAVGDVESAIDENRETQSRACAEFEHPHIAFDSVAESHLPHACKMRQGTAPLGDFSTCQRLTEKLHDAAALMTASPLC